MMNLNSEWYESSCKCTWWEEFNKIPGPFVLCEHEGEHFVGGLDLFGLVKVNDEVVEFMRGYADDLAYLVEPCQDSLSLRNHICSSDVLLWKFFVGTSDEDEADLASGLENDFYFSLHWTWWWSIVGEMVGGCIC